MGNSYLQEYFSPTDEPTDNATRTDLRCRDVFCGVIKYEIAFVFGRTRKMHIEY
jgi:hypothetical protein